MQIIVDEIDPLDCPFYARQSWDTHLPIGYDEGSCRLNTEPCYEGLYQWECNAKKGDKECPFCITYDELKRGRTRK